jgi:CMP/dCMP kinase
VSAPRVIAIDGAAGSGKSTLARGLARTLDLPYVNTGLMYRALAVLAITRGIDVDDASGLKKVTEGLRFILEGSAPLELVVPEVEVETLMSREVEAVVSAVSAHPGVRGLMRARQRAIGDTSGAVREGRDIASVVFPDAPLKLYLVADESIRVARRAAERRADERIVAEALQRRDRRDARTNPFRAAEGAVVLDTTDLDVEATLDAALEIARREAPWLFEDPTE